MKQNYFLGLLCLAGAVAGAHPAYCQTTEERAGARAAADRGYDAFKAGDWAEALDLFERAESLVHSPVQALYIARSHARLGHLIEAQEAYLRVVREGMSPGASAAMRAARKEAEEELIPLEPQIPIVTVIVEGRAGRDPLEVQQDGRMVAEALVGVARPLNPGEHTWQASSGSRRSALETRTIEAGTQTTVTLRLPDAPAAGARSAEDPQPSTRTELAMSSADGPSAWVYGGFGLAVTGLAIGTGFLLYQGSLEDRIRCDAVTGCPETPENLELKEDADRAGVFSAVGFAAGGVGLVSALAIWALAPSSDPGPETGAATLRVQPWVGWNGASVSGSF